MTKTTTDACWFIYVLGGDYGPQKIGFSRRPDERRRQLGRTRYRVHTTVGVPPTDARAIERYAHYLLRDKRTRGEWFDVSLVEAEQAIRAAIRAVRKGATIPKGCKVGLGMTDIMVEGIDDWRSTQRPIPSRSQAIIALLEHAVAARADVKNSAALR